MSGMSRNEPRKDLVEYTRELQKRALASPKRKVDEEQKPKIRQLPITPNGTRPIPNEFVRTAIFSVFDNGPRRHLQNEKLASSEGIEIFFTGTTLSQADLTVYLSLVSVMSKIGELYCATAYSVLRECGKADTGKNRKDLEECLVRLRASTIKIKQGGNTYITGFLERAEKNSGSKHWEIILDRRIGNLFRSDNYTRLNWTVRKALARRTMALWLHAYYESHRTPYPVKVETIHRLCGSKAKCMYDFQKKLRLALIAVSNASAGQGKKFDFEIKDGMVFVWKNAKKNIATKQKSTDVIRNSYTDV